MILYTLLILLSTYSSLPLQAQDISQEDFYQTVENTDNAGIHCLTIDPKVNIIIFTASQKRQTPSELISFHKGLASANFFSTLEELIVIPGENNRLTLINNKTQAAFGWKKDGSAFIIDRITPTINVKIKDRIFTVNSLNCSEDNSPCKVYTPAFGEKTPHLSRQCTEIIVAAGKIENIYGGPTSKGYSKIPENGFVCSLSKGFNFAEIAEPLEVGDPVSLDINTTPTEPWSSMDFIVAGTLLEKSNPSDKKSAHAAIGITGNNLIKFFLVEQNPGLTPSSLATIMENEGCVTALSFSTDSTSTLVINKTMHSAHPLSHSFSFSKTGMFKPLEPRIARALIIKPLGD